MRILVIGILAVLSFCSTAFGQFRDHENYMNHGYNSDGKHNAKIAYLIDRLHLSETQAPKFISIYDVYDESLRGLKKSLKRINQYARNEYLSNDSALAMINYHLDFEERIIQLKKKYEDEFLKVLSPQQLVLLFSTEKEMKHWKGNKMHNGYRSDLQSDHSYYNSRHEW